MAHTPSERDPVINDRSRSPSADFPSLFHHAFEFVPDAVVEVDAEGTIVFANSKVEELFGYRPSELVGNPVEILIPRELQAAHVDRRARFAERPKSREMGSSIPFAGLRRDGTGFSADVALSPIQSPLYPGSHTFAFVRDVTHLRRLEIAERELLDKTLLGVVTTLNELMSLTSPLLYERTQSIRALVSQMVRGFDPAVVWQHQLSAALCLIGCATLPPDVFEKVWTAAPLSADEERIFQSHPRVAEKLLSHISRLEGVARIVGGQLTNASPEGGPVELGICVLQLAQHVDRLLYRDTPLPSILKQLRSRRPPYHEDLIEALSGYVPPETDMVMKALRLGELRTGMILDADLNTESGLFIAPAQTRINQVLLERIRNFSWSAGIHEPIRVRCPRDPAPQTDSSIAQTPSKFTK